MAEFEVADKDRTFVEGIEVLDKVGDGGFAAAAFTHDGGGAAFGNAEVELFKDLFACAVGERHVGEDYVANVFAGEGNLVGGFLAFKVDDFKQTVGSDFCLTERLVGTDQFGNRPCEISCKSIMVNSRDTNIDAFSEKTTFFDDP